MNTHNQSLTMSSRRLTRILFFFFLSQQFSRNTNTKTSITVVDAAYFDFSQGLANVPSCKDHGIMAGDSLDTDCVDHCNPNTMITFDYSDLGEDPNYVIRNTICRCLEDGESPSAKQTNTFECRTKDEVWDKKIPVMNCLDNYQITSLSTCQDWCKKIDPVAYEYSGFSGFSKCSCGGVELCDDKISAATATTVFTSTVLTLLMGCLMML